MNSKYSGMTVNERLFSANLMSEFDKSAKDRDKERMIEILKKVDLSDTQASETAELIIESPEKYGY